MAQAPETAEWASDLTQVIDPPSGTKASGFIPNTRPPAQYMNWILNILSRWTAYLAGARSGVLVGSPRLFTNPATAGHIGVFVDGLRTVNLDGGSFDVSSSIEVPGGSLLPATWFYVYAFMSSGALVLACSATAPDASLTWKSDAVGTHRYLGCFLTDGSGHPIPFHSVGGQYLWRTAVAGRQVLAGGSALSPAVVDCSAWAPPHARALLMHMDSTNSGTGPHTANLARPGDSVTEVLQVVSVGAGRATQQAWVTCGVQQVEYFVDDATMALSLSVQGFREA